MKHLQTLVLSLSALGLTGCVSSGKQLGLSAEITGLVSSTQEGKYALCDLDHLRLGRRPGSIKIRPYQKIETAQPLLARISKLGYPRDWSYDIILGPQPGGRGRAVGALKTSKPSFFVGDGWLLMRGWWPPAKTTWVGASSEGTTAVLQVIDDTRQRVFFLEGKSVTVTCLKDDTISQKLDDEGTFVEIRAGCEISAPTEISADAEASDFISEVTAIAAAAGIVI